MAFLLLRIYFYLSSLDILHCLIFCDNIVMAAWFNLKLGYMQNILCSLDKSTPINKPYGRK